MKFLLITYNDIDGVGQHVVSLHTNLKKIGHQSKIILLHKSKKSDEDIILVKRSYLIRGIFFSLEFLKKKFRTLFSFGNSTLKYNDIKDHVNDSDVIIIYTLHKFISLKMLKKILDTKKNVYLRPLDLELASGGCHVNFLNNGDECLKFKSGCNNCPQLNFLNFFNISNKIFQKKKRIMEKYKPNILLENNFTKIIYENAPITKSARNETLYLTVNPKRSNLIKKEDARKFFNISNTDIIILFGTFNLDAPQKGGRIIESIIKKFILILNSNDKYKKNLKNIRLVTFGRKHSFEINIPEIEWTHLGEIFEDQKLNSLYRSADLFVSPSTGCNGPHTVREALMNDLPVVAFDQGESQESVIDGVNGYLAPCFDEKIFSNLIFKALFSNELNSKDERYENLKLRFSPTSEAKAIAQKASQDLEKSI